MPRPRTKHEHAAFVACTAVALAIVVGMWVLSVRSIVAGGVAGTKEVYSSVVSTASEVKQQTAPDQETIDAVKAGFKTIFTPPAEEEAGTEREDAVSAAAEIMAEKIAAEETEAEPDVLEE